MAEAVDHQSSRSVGRFGAFADDGCCAMTPTAVVLAIIAIGTIARIFASLAIGIELDGSYTIVVARQLSWSYYDHPPMHQWLIWLSVNLFNSEAHLVVRLPFIALFAGTTWLMYRVTAHAFGAWAGVWAAALLNLCVVFTLFYGVFIVPDGPLFFFGLLTAERIARIVFDDGSLEHPLLTWVVAGAAGGAAMLSKYSAVFYFLGIFVYLLTVPTARRYLRTAGPWLGVVAAAVVFMPVILWNAQHDWVSFTFQGSRAGHGAHAGLGEVVGSIVAQFGYLTPWFFVPLAYRYGRMLWRGPADAASWFFVCLASGPILVFTLLNFLNRGLPHWTVPGWLLLFPLLGAWIAQASDHARRLMRRLALAGAALAISGLAVGVFVVRSGYVADIIAMFITTDKFIQSDPTLEVMDWNGIRAQLEARGDFDRTVGFVAGIGWSETGKVGYGFGREVPLLCLCRSADNDFRATNHFRYVDNYAKHAGATAIIVTEADNPVLNVWVRARFARIETLAPVRLKRRAGPVADFVIYRGVGFIPPVR